MSRLQRFSEFTDPYLGRCRVIHAIGKGPLVTWEHLKHAHGNLPPRVLVRTYERAPVDRWDPLLAAYAPEAIEMLACITLAHEAYSCE